jgi:putative PIG3 family NAD(P)H quinone oxidoreductase
MKIKNKMNCITIKSYGKPENLLFRKENIPDINENEVLIEVHASGVNRPDVLQRKGLYAAPVGASKILGLEVSGKIVKLGNKVKHLKLNQKVCALTHGGGYAEYCNVYSKHVLPIPKRMDFFHAAAIPENFFTVWYNLFDRGKIKSGETLLIHGGSSGIGTIAIQLAKHHGCKVITTVGNKNKQTFCKKLGADLVINYKESDFFKITKEYTNNSGVNVVLDMVGQKYFSKNISILKDQGRLIMIAFLSGSLTKADLTQVMTKRLILTGSTLRPRTNQEKSRIAKNLYKRYWTALTKKTIKPIIFKTYDLKNAWKAHELMETSNHMGKIVLKIK